MLILGFSDFSYLTEKFVDMGLLTILLFVYGAGMLNRKNWARMLYLWLTPLLGIMSLVFGATFWKWVIAFCVYGVFARILTRPEALEYFDPLAESTQKT